MFSPCSSVLAGAGAHRAWPAGLVHAASVVNFIATDDVGPWFQCVGAGCVQAGTQSLAVVNPGTDVRITVGQQSGTVHTFSSLIYPAGAQQMPFDQPAAFRADSKSVTLTDPGLYVFVCKVHPFMLAATIVDDPATEGLDLGEDVSLVNGITVPTSSDLATRLLRAFWLITNPLNYQDHNPATNPSMKWTINYPAGVPVRISGGAVVDLKDTLEARYGNNLPLPAPFKPTQKGVGEVWIDTEYENTAGKSQARHRDGGGRQLLEGHQEGRAPGNQHEQSPQHVDRRRSEADLPDAVVRHEAHGVRPHHRQTGEKHRGRGIAWRT